MRFHPLGLLLIVTALLAPATRLRAQTIPFPTTVNGVPAGERLVEVVGDDVHMRRSDLEEFGAGGPLWDRLITFGRLRAVAAPVEGAEAVSLRSLSPYVEFALDQENVALTITIKAQLLKPSVIESRPQKPADILYSHDHSGFFNYSISSPAMHNYSVFGELGATVGNGLLYTAVSRAPNGTIVRGLSNFTYDEVSKLRRWSIGDSTVSTEILGGNAIIAGVTVARNFNLDPYFIRYPSLNLSGTALTPSQVDVYVNGVLVGRHDVAPGPFQLHDVPIAAGAGNTQIVVRDAFGRQVTTGSDYYFGTNLLTPGLSEYVYSAGVLRTDFGTSSFGTDDGALVAYHRVGINDALTLGGRGEASRGLVSVGPIVDLGTRIGEWRIAGAYSRNQGVSGTAGELGYRYLSRRFGVGANWLHLSDEYSNLSLAPAGDRALNNLTAFGFVSAHGGSVNLQWSRTAMRDSAVRSRGTLGFTMPLTRWAAGLASVSRVFQNGAAHNEYFAGASINLGYATTGSVSVTTLGNGHSTAAVDVARALPIGSGYGYRIQEQVDNDGNRVDLGSFDYQTEFGRYEIAVSPSSTHRPTLTAAGALVFAGNRLHFALPVQDSYALVEVPGVANVRVFSANQLVGRTDRNGNILVPNLLAYYGNPLRIEDKDVPMTYQIDDVDRTVAPPYRGGAVVVFPVKQHRSVTGKLTVITGATSAPPALGDVTLSGGGKSWDSPIGRDGEFYLEDIPSGTYDAKIGWKDGTCSLRLTIPATTGDVNLGNVSCTRKP